MYTKNMIYPCQLPFLQPPTYNINTFYSSCKNHKFIFLPLEMYRKVRKTITAFSANLCLPFWGKYKLQVIFLLYLKFIHSGHSSQ